MNFDFMDKWTIHESYGKSKIKSYSLWCIPIALVLLFSYLFTAPPHTTMEDAGEFTLMAHFLGLAHPPGYPLYTLLAHPFSYLSFISPALRIALFSMLCTIGTGYLVGLIVTRLSGDIFAACVAFFIFGISWVSWSQAIVVEVYAFHALLMTALFWFALEIRSHPSQKLVLIWSLLFAMALSHHWPLVILGSPAFAVLLWPQRKQFLRAKGKVLLALLVGLSPYLYLFAPHHHSGFSFLGGINSVNDFFSYVLREEYTSRQTPIAKGLRDAFLFLRDFALLLFRDSWGVGILLAGLSIYLLSKRKDQRPLALAFALGIAGSVLLLLLFWPSTYTIFSRDLYTSFQTFAFAMVAILMGLSASAVDQAQYNQTKRWLFRSVVIGVAALVFWTHLRGMDMSSDTLAGDYARITLKNLPPNSVLMMHGDEDGGPLAYQHFLLGDRRDVELVSAVGSITPKKIFSRDKDVRFETHHDKIISFIESKFNEGKRVFVIKQIPYFSPSTKQLPFNYADFGWFMEVIRGENPQAIDVPKLKADTFEFLNKVPLYKKVKQFPSFREELIAHSCRSAVISGVDHPELKTYSPCQYGLAEWLVQVGRDYKNAEMFFRLALEGHKEWPFEARLVIAGRLLHTRLLLVNALITEEEKKSLSADTLRLLSTYVEKWPHCRNPVAPGLLQLNSQLDSQHRLRSDLVDRFRTCSWFGKGA